MVTVNSLLRWLLPATRVDSQAAEDSEEWKDISPQDLARYIEEVEGARQAEQQQKLDAEAAQAKKLQEAIYAAGDRHFSCGSKPAAPMGALIGLECAIPDTSVSLAALTRSGPHQKVLVTTEQPHKFTPGQFVVLSGLKLPGPASQQPPTSSSSVDLSAAIPQPTQFSELALGALQSEHRIEVVDSRSFYLEDVQSEVFPCGAEVNVEEAFVVGSVGSWARGRVPALHDAIFSAAQRAEEAGILRLGDIALDSMFTNGGAIVDLAVARCHPTSGTFQGFPVLLAAFARRSFKEDIKKLGASIWQKIVQRTQPAHWQNSCEAIGCSVCAGYFHGVGEDGRARQIMWKHHCRHCGLCVCNGCSPHRELVPWFGHDKRPVRVCTKCLPVVQHKNETVRTYGNWKGVRDFVARSPPPPPPSQPARPAAKKAPALPPKGKGKGKGQGKGNGAATAAGATSHGQVTQPEGAGSKPVGARKLGFRALQLEEFPDLCVLEPDGPGDDAAAAAAAADDQRKKELRFSATRPRPSSSARIILKDKEVKAWHVARRSYEPYLQEIARCLEDASCHGANDLEEWLAPLEQILPLEGKLSQDSLKILSDFDLEAESTRLAEMETAERTAVQHICLYFLRVPLLQHRLAAVRALSDLKSEQEHLQTHLRMLTGCYDGLLLGGQQSASGPDGDIGQTQDCAGADKSTLRPDVRRALIILSQQSKVSDLKSLANRSKTAVGREAILSMWQDPRRRTDLESFCDALQPLISAQGPEGADVRYASEMKGLWKKSQERRAVWQSLSEAANASQDPKLQAASQELGTAFAALEKDLAAVFEKGLSVLQALGEYSAATPSFPKERLAEEVDQCVKYLQAILASVEAAGKEAGAMGSRPCRKRKAEAGSDGSEQHSRAPKQEEVELRRKATHRSQWPSVQRRAAAAQDLVADSGRTGQKPPASVDEESGRGEQPLVVCQQLLSWEMSQAPSDSDSRDVPAEAVP